MLKNSPKLIIEINSLYNSVIQELPYNMRGFSIISYDQDIQYRCTARILWCFKNNYYSINVFQHEIYEYIDEWNFKNRADFSSITYFELYEMSCKICMLNCSEIRIRRQGWCDGMRECEVMWMW